MRVYYDRDGRPRGYSQSLGEAWFWNGSLIGLFLQLCLAVFLLPLYWFPRAVWRSRLTPPAKLLVIGGVWGALILIGVLSNAHTHSEALAKGCGISEDNIPSDYLQPSDSYRCPDGYLPTRGCIVTVNTDPANGTGGCDYGEKPWTFVTP
jgi:hypothetical protein